MKVKTSDTNALRKISSNPSCITQSQTGVLNSHLLPSLLFHFHLNYRLWIRRALLPPLDHEYRRLEWDWFIKTSSVFQWCDAVLDSNQLWSDRTCVCVFKEIYLGSGSCWIIMEYGSGVAFCSCVSVIFSTHGFKWLFWPFTSNLCQMYICSGSRIGFVALSYFQTLSSNCSRSNLSLPH